MEQRNETAQAGTAAATAAVQVRLLPLTEGAPNEKLANGLAHLLIDDEAQAALGAQAALLILTGVQIFIDSGGDYAAVEQLWEPNVVARQLDALHGPEAWKKAAEMAESYARAGDQNKADIHKHAALMLRPIVTNNPVDEK